MTPEIDALHAQIDALKKQLSAARRAAVPQPVRDYTFANPDGSPVTLRALFDAKRDLVVIHNMGKACVYCTLWADGLRGYTDHLSDRAALVLSSPDEPAVLRAFAVSRAWRFRCVSTQGGTSGFSRDMGFEPEPDRYWPGVSAFRLQDDGTIVRTGKAQFGPGDDFCAVWPLMDLLHLGDAGWAPKYAYAS